MKRIFYCVSVFLFLAGCTTDAPHNDARNSLWYEDREINLVIVTAWDHFSAERYDQALHDFERLIAKGYDHYDVLFGAALSSLKINDRAGALKYFSRCLARRPDHFDSLYFRGEMFFQIKDTVHARTDLDAVVRCETRTPLLCGLYPSRHADNAALQQKRADAKKILEKL
jgi:tetratricopeptide (TPR) repeat protein